MIPQVSKNNQVKTFKANKRLNSSLLPIFIRKSEVISRFMKTAILTKKKIRKILTLTILVLVLISCQSKSKKQPIAKNGHIDLSSWNFDQDGIANLSGEWKLYWGKQIRSLDDLDTAAASKLSNLPGFWRKEGLGKRYYFKNNGLATYHLRLSLPDTINTYAIKLNAIYSSYALWVDHQLLTKVGEPTLSAETTVPSFETRLVSLPQKKQVDLFLCIASWTHVKGGGSLSEIPIGTESQIHDYWLKNLIVQLFSFAIISGLAIYLIVLFFFYPNNPNYIYVGLFALFGAIRGICVDEMVIQYLVDDFPYFWNQRLRYIGFYASLGFIVLAINQFFQGFMSKKVKYIAYALFLYSLFTLIMPFKWATYIVPIFQLMTIGTTAYCFYAIIRSIRAKQHVVEGILFMASGFVILGTMIRFILRTNLMPQSTFYHSLGYVVFIFIQMLILAYWNKKTYNKANQLSNELAVLNKGLEAEVEKRTQEVHHQKNKISEQAEALTKANEQLQELDEVKNRFFANISHELRTPLTLILGGVSNIKKQNHIEDKSLKLIEKQSNLLQQLINQLLDLTKLESGKMELNLTKESIVRLLKGYFYSFESLAVPKEVELLFQCNVTESHVYIDKKAFEKIIYNLLSNAHKFTPKSGQVSMEVEVMDNQLSIVITDTGIGIPQNQLPYIFDRFYQVDDSLKRNFEGTGIGLALVKELVELHAGTIQVTSQEGIGSTFHLSIPVKHAEEMMDDVPLEQQEVIIEMPIIAEQASENVLEHTYEPSSSDKAIVLVVEDHPELQQLIADELKDEFTVIRANDGEQGIAMAISHIPDLIVSDVMMPHKNGYDLCAYLKKDERTSHIPIVLLTARAAQEDKIQGLEIGADDYLAKPFDPKELQIRVQNLIQNRMLLREKFSKKQDILIYKPEEVVENELDRGFIDKYLDVIERSYVDETFGVDQIADALNISKRQLHRKLNAISGVTPGKMLQNFRLQKAKELLLQKEVQVKEVSFSVGFSSQSYFIKCFKNQFGITPKEFQNNTQNTG